METNTETERIYMKEPRKQCIELNIRVQYIAPAEDFIQVKQSSSRNVYMHLCVECDILTR